MAVELKPYRWCDYHLREKQEHVEATEWGIAFAVSTGRPVDPLVVDLCEDCVEQFGRPVLDLIETLTAKAQGKRTPTAMFKAGDAVEAGTPVIACPYPGCEVERRQGGMKSHLETEHGLTPGQADYKFGVATTSDPSKPMQWVCFDHEDSPHGFRTSQGYTMHRTKGHGDTAGLDTSPNFDPEKRKPLK